MMPDSPAALQGALVPWQGIRAVPPFSHVPAHRQGEEASVAASQMPPFLIHLFLALIRRRASASLENRGVSTVPKAAAPTNPSARLLEMVPLSSPLARSSKNCSTTLPFSLYTLLKYQGKCTPMSDTTEGIRAAKRQKILQVRRQDVGAEHPPIRSSEIPPEPNMATQGPSQCRPIQSFDICEYMCKLHIVVRGKISEEENGYYGEGQQVCGAAGEDERRLLQGGNGPCGGAAGAQRAIRAGDGRRFDQGAQVPGREQPRHHPGAHRARREAARRLPDPRRGVGRGLHGPGVRALLLLQGGPGGGQEGSEVRRT